MLFLLVLCLRQKQQQQKTSQLDQTNISKERQNPSLIRYILYNNYQNVYFNNTKTIIIIITLKYIHYTHRKKTITIKKIAFVSFKTFTFWLLYYSISFKLLKYNKMMDQRNVIYWSNFVYLWYCTMYGTFAHIIMERAGRHFITHFNQIIYIIGNSLIEIIFISCVFSPFLMF